MEGGEKKMSCCFFDFEKSALAAIHSSQGLFCALLSMFSCWLKKYLEDPDFSRNLRNWYYHIYLKKKKIYWLFRIITLYGVL